MSNISLVSKLMLILAIYNFNVNAVLNEKHQKVIDLLKDLFQKWDEECSVKVDNNLVNSLQTCGSNDETFKKDVADNDKDANFTAIIRCVGDFLPAFKDKKYNNASSMKDDVEKFGKDVQEQTKFPANTNLMAALRAFVNEMPKNDE